MIQIDTFIKSVGENVIDDHLLSATTATWSSMD